MSKKGQKMVSEVEVVSIFVCGHLCLQKYVVFCVAKLLMLLQGYFFSDEPGYYEAGQFGIRLETDLVTVFKAFLSGIKMKSRLLRLSQSHISKVLHCLPISHYCLDKMFQNFNTH